MRRKKLRLFKVSHMAFDSLLVAGSWYFAYFLRKNYFPSLEKLNPVESYLSILPAIVLAWFFISWFFDIYNYSPSKTTLESTQNLLKSVLIGLLLTSSIAFLLKKLEIGRSVVLLSSSFNLVLLTLSRILFANLERRFRSQIHGTSRAIILGAGNHGIRILQKLHDSKMANYDIVGFLDDDDSKQGKSIEQIEVLGTTSDVVALVKEKQVDEVFVAIPEFDHTIVFPMMLGCGERHVTFWMLTNDFEALSRGQSNLQHIDNLPITKLGDQKGSRLYDWSKRIFDIVAASAALVITAPFWVWWAIRIKLDSAGPVIFSQKRVGHNGKEFTIYKFRTMTTEADPYGVAPKTRGDARVTEYGKWLRRTSIDEVPQLINVLLGNMTLVGPRPEMPFIVAEYEDWQRYRLKVKPGLTGLWQILGRKDLPMHENLHYDFYYIRNRSFLLDITILFRTVFVVFGGKGAF